jgi:hypothetical protein
MTRQQFTAEFKRKAVRLLENNSMAENFFSALKKGRIKLRIYPTRAGAASDLFDYIEMFYKPIPDVVFVNR